MARDLILVPFQRMRVHNPSIRSSKLDDGHDEVEDAGNGDGMMRICQFRMHVGWPRIITLKVPEFTPGINY